MTQPADRFGLYFHIPICVAKCPYCDFVSYPLDALTSVEREIITESLADELDLALSARPELRGRPLDSIYFGGGTPSLLPADVVADLLEQARGSFAPREPVEVTLECNPVSSEIERLEAYREAGVTRISLGAQSFNDSVLKNLGRLHAAQQARDAIARIRSLDFASWGFDLIFGAPGSTLEQWRKDLAQAIALRPPHLSVYGLTLHEGTELYERYAACDKPLLEGNAPLPDEETLREMFLMARRMLTEAGWRHYEISNYALPGHESRHNSLYWTGGEYLGIGVSAHSYLGGRRMANPALLTDYLKRLEAGEFPATVEALPSVRARRGERIMLALRQLDGFDPQEIGKTLGCDFLKEYGSELGALEEHGLLVVSKRNVRLSEEGLLLSDLVFEAFF